MNQAHYKLQTSSDRLQFEFVSEGPRGQIIKRIEYSYVEDLDFWNLGFGDYNPNIDRVDDQIISDNGDGRKVLATVAFSLQEFMILRPNAIVFFTGSNEQRTQIYGWAISKYWQDLSTSFRVEGITEASEVVPFQPQQHYLGFLIHKK
ncbi:hypothetical protein BH09BAC4_BH09BAC4_24770 [soil metagenome]